MGSVAKTLTGTLTAATPATVVVDCGNSGPVSFGAIIRNTGSTNALGTTTVAVSNDGTNAVTDSSISVPSLAASTGKASIANPNLGFRYVHITMTSASGTDYSIEYQASW